MKQKHKLAFSSLTDEEVISRIITNGDSFLFEILYYRYFDKVMDKCFTMLKNRDLASESALEIMARAYEKLKSFKGSSTYSTWLYSITYNYCIDFLREKKKLHYPDWNRQHELPEIEDDEIDDSEDISYDKLMELLEKLHPEEKALLLMKYQDNLSLKQISESLRVTESAVKMRLKRAKNRILYLHKSTSGTK